MKKQLTKKETLKSGSNVTYFKLHFGNQWFMVVPWHYEPAKLMDVFDKCAGAVEGETYDIKWRGAKIGGRTATLITSIEPVVEEFVWDGEEMGADDSSNTSQEAHSGVLDTSPKQPYIVSNAKPLETHTEGFQCHMCGKPFNVCVCEIPF